jgi:hypothetical protein
MNLVLNERTKLRASALDRASTACVTVGVAAPLASVILGLSVNGVDARYLVASCYEWIVVAIGLHMCASQILGTLRE